MKIAVVCDAHVFRTKNNEYWCTNVYSYSFFKRFMDVYDEVRVVARVKNLEFPTDGKYLRLDGKNLEVYPVTFFQGPKELFFKIGSILHSLNGFYDGCDVILYRMPSTTAQLAYLKSKSVSIPRGVEVVYNVRDELNDNTLSLPRKLISLANDRFLASACKNRSINGVSYVTEETLQRYYPSYARIHGSSSEHFENHYSTLQYKADYIGAPKAYVSKNNWKLINVVIHIQSKLRGHETMIRALKIIRDAGYDATMEFIGDGPLIDEFKNLSESLGVSDHVIWTGLLPSSADVNEHLKNSDIFVYPTHFAGLPRVLIEAMGAGLPCVGTPVAGIPEMLNEADLFPVDDDKALAKRLIALFNDAEYLEEQSRRNILRAQDFTDDKLQARRNDFYMRLKKLTK